MKRGGPIERKTPIRRSGSLPRVTHLRGRSAKGAAEDRERGKVLRAKFPEHEWHGCAVPLCGREANDAHEKLSRGRGGSAVDPENITPLCRLHHDAAHGEDPALYVAGLIKHSWEAS